MSEESSRSSQDGLDGLPGDFKQHTVVHRTQTAPCVPKCRPHPPVTRVCTGPRVEKGRSRLQTNINPSLTTHLNSTQVSQRASGQGVNDGSFPPPYSAHHRLAGSQTSPQLAVPQARLSATQNDSASTKEARMVPQSPEWRDWQRDRYQIWQLLSSDNADTLPETLVWSQTVNSCSVSVEIWRDQSLLKTIVPHSYRFFPPGLSILALPCVGKAAILSRILSRWCCLHVQLLPQPDYYFYILRQQITLVCIDFSFCCLGCSLWPCVQSIRKNNAHLIYLSKNIYFHNSRLFFS